MGFFSWKTSDTNKSIPNTYSKRETFDVTMLDDKGNKYLETQYEGYGEFGGKDYYELLDEMNGGDGDRDKGLLLAHPPRLIKANEYPKGHKIGMLQEDGERIWYLIADYNKSVRKKRKTLRNMVVKFPILVEDDSVKWDSKLAPKNCKYQGYFYGW